jgi:hypothetical protein
MAGTVGWGYHHHPASALINQKYLNAELRLLYQSFVFLGSTFILPAPDDPIRWPWERRMTCWIEKEVLDLVPELPHRVDFDDWQKERGMVNLLSQKKNSKAWLPAGFYRSTKGGRLCVLEVRRSLKGSDQAVWLEKPKVRVKAQTQTI